jgi:hypothetical protein
MNVKNVNTFWRKPMTTVASILLLGSLFQPVLMLKQCVYQSRLQ